MIQKVFSKAKSVFNGGIVAKNKVVSKWLIQFKFKCKHSKLYKMDSNGIYKMIPTSYI